MYNHMIGIPDKNLSQPKSPTIGSYTHFCSHLGHASNSKLLEIMIIRRGGGTRGDDGGSGGGVVT